MGIMSCARKFEYSYEDVIVTRYEYPRRSEFYCNRSDPKCKIEVSGSQNFYRAYLCINRETKKVLIMRYDCYICQSFIDYDNFQAELYPEQNIDSVGLQETINIRSLMKRNPKLFEQKYALYILCGVQAYVDGEEEFNRENNVHYTSNLIPIVKHIESSKIIELIHQITY